MKNFSKLTISIVGCELVGLLSSIFTLSSLPTWYKTLIKPSFAPPNWLFAPAWTLLYFLMGLSFYLVWRLGWKKKSVRSAAWLFLAQLSLNFLWSPVFFGLRSPLLGLIVIFSLLTLIFATIKRFYPLSQPAAYLLIPYLLWVSFATVLNLAIVILN